MTGVEKTADEGENIAYTQREAAVPRHKTDARYTQHRSQHVEFVWAAPIHDPVQKGDDDAVNGGEKGVFAWGSVYQTVVLYGIGGIHKQAHDGAPPPTGAIHPLPVLPKYQRQHHGGYGEAEGQQELEIHAVQSVFHNKKGGAPDQGGNDTEGLGQFFQQIFVHGINSGFAKGGSGGKLKKRGYVHAFAGVF